MTVQKFIYNNAGLTNENNLEDKPSICGLCNTYAEKTISSKKIFSGNFTNYEYFKNDRLCEHCVNLIKNSKSEDMRRSSFICTENGNDYFKNSELYKKLFKEKQLPFTFCVTYSFKKLNSFRAVLNYSNEEYYIRQEDNLILFKVNECKVVFKLMLNLYFNNFTKSEILKGDYNKVSIQKFGIQNFLNIENELKKSRGKDYFELLTVALPAELRKIKKEEKDAINKSRNGVG